MQITRYALALALVMCVAASHAADIPPQFPAWGSTAGEQLPLPADWSEAPPPSDDLSAPEGWPAAADAARGFALFTRGAVDPIYPGSYPRRDDGSELRAFAYLGEYVPLQLGVRALKDLKAVTVVLGSLTQAGGTTLEANQFDVRVVRCQRVSAKRGTKTFYWQPTSLEKPEVTDIAQGTTQTFWITAYVAAKTAPGDYTGKATLKSGQTQLTEISIRLKVLPLRLKKPPQMYCMWQGEPIENESEYFKVTRDLWEHGMNASWPALQGEVAKRDPANKTRRLPAEHLVPMRAGSERRADLWKQTDFAKHPRASIGTPNINWTLWSWDQKKGWSAQWPLNEHLDANLCTQIQLLEDVRKEKGLPEILYYLYDEAGGHPDTFPFALHYYKLLKEKFPHLKTFTTIGGGVSMGIDEIGQFAPVMDIMSSNRISEKIIKDIRKHKRELHIYNGGTTVQSPPGKDRLFFGFYGWKTTATGIGQWVHHRGKISSAHVRNADDHGYVNPSPDGPVPTIHWEAFRAGVADMRYIVTLYDLIQQAKKSAKPEAEKEAAAAELSLAEIDALIPIPTERVAGHTEAAGTLSPRTYDKWRWRLAQHVLKLNSLLGLGEGSEGEIPMPQREYKYSAAAAAVQVNESELVSASFEDGLGSFSVQAWKGKGSGEVDKSKAHGGKASVLLSTSAADDVLVCVCDKAKPALKAGKTYRFSGWVKTENVAMGVKLRISCKAPKETMGISGSEDWKQLSCEYTPKEDETAKYFAVWLQGVGKVWVDDLRITEAQSAPETPLTLELSNRVVDSDDQAVTLKLKHSAGKDPLKLKLHTPDSKEAKELVLAVGGEQQVVLNAAQLALGKHNIRAEWPSGDQSISIERVRGPFEK